MILIASLDVLHKHTDDTDWMDEHGFFLFHRNFDFAISVSFIFLLNVDSFS
jgi:hypothetical protein